MIFINLCWLGLWQRYTGLILVLRVKSRVSHVQYSYRPNHCYYYFLNITKLGIIWGANYDRYSLIRNVANSKHHQRLQEIQIFFFIRTPAKSAILLTRKLLSGACCMNETRPQNYNKSMLTSQDCVNTTEFSCTHFCYIPRCRAGKKHEKFCWVIGSVWN